MRLSTLQYDIDHGITRYARQPLVVAAAAVVAVVATFVLILIGHGYQVRNPYGNPAKAIFSRSNQPSKQATPPPATANASAPTPQGTSNSTYVSRPTVMGALLNPAAVTPSAPTVPVATPSVPTTPPVVAQTPVVTPPADTQPGSGGGSGGGSLPDVDVPCLCEVVQPVEEVVNPL